MTGMQVRYVGKTILKQEIDCSTTFNLNGLHVQTRLALSTCCSFCDRVSCVLPTYCIPDVHQMCIITLSIA